MSLRRPEVIDRSALSRRHGYDGWAFAWRHSGELVPGRRAVRTRAQAREAREEFVGLFPDAMPVDVVKVRVEIHRIP